MAKTKKDKTSKFTLWGNPILHSPTKPISRKRILKPEFKRLISKMFRDMHNGLGIGLAANQIGLPISLVVIELRPRRHVKAIPKTVVINPRIIKYSRAKINLWEGCLSCGSIRVCTERSKSVEVNYIDGNNKKITRSLSGIEAIVFQHEIDHLNGIVCGERIITRKGHVVPGSIITFDWLDKHPHHPLPNKY